MKNIKPILYMTVGLPGSGKSHWCNKHKDELNAVVHSSDAIREELGDVNDQSKNAEVFEILHKRIKDDLRSGKNVIYDATNLSRKRRIHFMQHELRDISCEKVCILFATPYEMCLARNFARDRQVPEEVLVRMIKSFETPWFSEGWDDIQIVWADYKGLPGFEYDIMEDMDRWTLINHDNPHHRMSIGDHMLNAEFHYVKKYNVWKPHLQLAIFMHDCGKPDVKAFINSKGEDCDIAHFYSHESLGSYKSLFYIRELCDDYTDKDVLYVSLLIGLHMRPHLSWKQSEKAKTKDRILFGDDIIRDIEILHECDLAAH